MYVAHHPSVHPSLLHAAPLIEQNPRHGPPTTYRGTDFLPHLTSDFTKWRQGDTLTILHSRCLNAAFYIFDPFFSPISCLLNQARGIRVVAVAYGFFYYFGYNVK